MSKRTRNKNLARFTRKKQNNSHKTKKQSKDEQEAGCGRQKTGNSALKRKISNKNWIWGTHAVVAALKNPKRTHHELVISSKWAEKLDKNLLKSSKAIIKIAEIAELDHMFQGASHQGMALKCAPLPEADLSDIINEQSGLLIVLDQITDPHNVGAIFRLAGAFGAKAVIMQSRHTPPLSGALAKVAVGMIETVPHVSVTNIANTLLRMRKNDWRVTGLAGEADIILEQAFVNANAEVLVLGAESKGLRKRVRDCCDQLARIPMSEIYGTESLNVATATAIAMYEASKKL